MQRYFASIINNKINLTDDDQHHLLHVMRMGVGDRIETIIDSRCFLLEISNTNPLTFNVIEEFISNSEIGKELTLFFALAKGDKIEFVLQKATELGATKIVLFKSKRCVVKFDESDFARKVVRYNKIVKEASEQCHRVRIPEIVGVVDINKIPNELLGEANFIAYEKEVGDTTKSFDNLKDYNSLTVMVGPEGGFEESEVNKLVSLGFTSISLGRRILRCETAALYALSVMSYLLEK